MMGAPQQHRFRRFKQKAVVSSPSLRKRLNRSDHGHVSLASGVIQNTVMSMTDAFPWVLVSSLSCFIKENKALS
jgi:hypothetical protein